MSVTQDDIQRLMKLMVKQYEDQIETTIKSGMLYGRGHSKNLFPSDLHTLMPEYLGVDFGSQDETVKPVMDSSGNVSGYYYPMPMILDEWGDVPGMIYERISYEDVPHKDGPKSRNWTQPIPDPQADKPVSSPSSTKRAKLRAKRKKRK